MPLSYIFISFIIGTLFGSFFYTLALRYIDGSIEESPLNALFSSSRCPACGERINPLFLIPILGFILLRGKCARCKAPISWRYPFSEAIFGLVSATVFINFGIGVHSVTIFFLTSVLLTISVIDVETLTIPDSLIIIFLIISLYEIIAAGNILSHVYGFLMMFLFFIVILLIFPGSFGGGDLKLASVIGFYLGLDLSIIALESSLITGAVLGILYGILSGKGLRIKIYFAPFLAVGFILSVFFGNDILLMYYSLFY